MADDQTIICTGCENACEVVVSFTDGRPRVLGGNNCPTGEVFALAQASSQTRQNKTDGDNNEQARLGG